MANRQDELALYFQEARELLALLENVFLQAKQTTLSVEQIQAAFRAVHTMKGSASIYEFTQIVSLTHQLESVLEKFRNAPEQLPQPLINLLLACIDLLSEQIDAIAQTGQESALLESKLKHLLQHLQRLASDQESPEKEVVVQETVTVAATSVDTENSEQQYIRIPVKQLDYVLDLIGELVVASAANELVSKINQDLQLQESAQQVVDLTAEIREATLAFRMVKIQDIFQRFPRAVREICRELHKDVDLEIIGEDTELDKTMMENVASPLIHLMRNAVDHGIEKPEVRTAKGKSPKGKVTLFARHESGSVVISVTDDGQGLNKAKIKAKAFALGLLTDAVYLTDQDIYQSIFVSGFSTAEHVTEISGRGVGMDIVKQDIELLHGVVEIASEENVGTTITLRIPLTLSMIDGFLVTVGDMVFVVPMNMAVECLNIRQYAMQEEMVTVRDRTIPVMYLRSLLGMEDRDTPRQNAVILHHANRYVGLVVDGFAGQCQMVIKPLSPIFKKLKGLSGSTILGDGRVAFILDIPSLVHYAEVLEQKSVSIS